MDKKSFYNRILLKLSGEALIQEGQTTGVDHDACKSIVHSIKNALETKVQIGIVIGGGNLFRGHTIVDQLQIPRTKADYIGMLATMMNSLILQSAFKSINIPCQVMTHVECPLMIERFNYEQANAYLNQNQVLIFAGGSGNPYFTTDTAASLMALSINADILLKATKVDGIYDKDPKQHPDAKKFDSLTYSQVLNNNLNIMDATAISLCREHKLPLAIFNMYKKENLIKMIHKQNCGTIVTGD